LSSALPVFSALRIISASVRIISASVIKSDKQFCPIAGCIDAYGIKYLKTSRKKTTNQGISYVTVIE